MEFQDAYCHLSQPCHQWLKNGAESIDYPKFNRTSSRGIGGSCQFESPPVEWNSLKSEDDSDEILQCRQGNINYEKTNIKIWKNAELKEITAKPTFFDFMRLGNFS